jgi:photosystem II stability/assembly factor-like uncharacterized protein
MIRVRPLIRIVCYTALTLSIRSGAAHAQYWLPDTNGLSIPVGSLAIDANGVIFAGAELIDRGGAVSPEGVYRSTDHGNTWNVTPQSPSEFPLGPVYGINLKGVNPNGDIFVGGSYEYRSTDEGESWQQFRLEPLLGTDPPVLAFTALNVGTTGKCNLFIATGSTGLYVSENDGNTWGDIGNLFDSSFATYVASTSWGAIFQASATGLEIGNSGDGESFDSTIPGAPLLGQGINIASNATGLIVAGGTGGLFFTLDTGHHWEPPTALPGSILNSTYYILAVAENGDIYAGINSTDAKQGGIVVSTDTGRSWQDIHAGLKTDTINALAFDNYGALLAATDNGVFTYYPTGGVKTGANEAQTALTLEQNTPNPFSSNTAIRFTLPEAGPVSLRVFDATGREVGTIASGNYEAGTYSTSFNADGLPDGAYYYRLESDGQTAARMFVVEH